LVSFVGSVQATSYRTSLDALGGSLGLKGNPNAFIGNIIIGILSLIGVITLVLIIYAGFLWLTSQGDATKVTKAKSIMIYAFIGLLIILASYVIVNFVIFDIFLSSTA
jgi:hypothetical protein